MARPRLHAPDDLLDVAEQIVTEADPAGLTLRSLAQRGGVPTGTIYHAFGSKEELLARLWLRATARLGASMEAAMTVLEDESSTPADAVVAVALAPVALVRRHPASARLFFTQRPDQLFTSDLPAELAAEIKAVQARFQSTLATLANAMWSRSDGPAIDAIATCVVDLPGGLLRRRLLEGRRLGSTVEERIEACVRATLALPLPHRA